MYIYLLENDKTTDYFMQGMQVNAVLPQRIGKKRGHSQSLWPYHDRLKIWEFISYFLGASVWVCGNNIMIVIRVVQRRLTFCYPFGNLCHQMCIQL